MRIVLSIVFVSGALLAGCAQMQSSVKVTSYASETPNFSLSRPAVFKTDTGLELSGRVCRRARSTLLSPAGVRIEQITGDERLHRSLTPAFRAYRAGRISRARLMRATWPGRWRMGTR